MSGFTYDISNNIITLATYSGVGSTVATIPDSVTSIGDRAFAYTVITGFICTTSSGLKTIGIYSFVNCPNLTSVTLGTPNLLSIDMGCFQNCSSLTSIEIPNTVTLINTNCFVNCTSLSSVRLPTSITSIRPSCFSGCTSLPGITIPSSIVFMGNNCFYECTSLLSITIPSAVTLIDSSAFRNCTGLTSVTLNRVGTNTTLNTNSFLNTPSINKTTMIHLLSKRYNPPQLTTAGFAPSIISRFIYTISSNNITGITDSGIGTTYAVIPDSVTSIANSVFSNNTVITEFICTSGSLVTGFGTSLFSGCTNLTSVSLNSTSLKSLSNSCFASCTSLPSITIPSAVTLIDTNAFQNCTGLTSVTLNCLGTTTVFGSNSFIGTTTSINKTTMIHLLSKGYTPSQLTTAGFAPSIISRFTYTISNNDITAVTVSGTGATYAVIPDSVTSIANSVFSNISVRNVITEFICTSGSLLNSFGTSTFSVCTNLTSVSLNSTSLKSLSNSCFGYCTRLTSITIPNSVTIINTGCFENCSSLPSIEIPNSVKSIDYSAFSECTSLSSIIIPDSVTSILDGCFYNCTSLSSIILSNSLTSISEGCFENCNSLLSVTIPSAVTFITSNAFSMCTVLTSVTLNCVGTTTVLGSNSFLGTTTSINKTTMTNLLAKGYTPSQLTIARFVPSIISRFTYTISSNNITAVTSSGTGTTYAVIPDSVTSIANSVFSNNIDVRNVITEFICTSGSLLNRFGTTVFQDCTNLTTVTLGSTYLITIGNSCFSNCTSVQSITIPSAVTLVDTNAFQNCTGLTLVTLNCVGTNTTLNTNSFLNTPSINYSTVRNLLVKGYTQSVLTNAGFPTISRFTYDISNNIITQVYDNGYGTTVATIPNSVTSTVNNIFSNINIITDLICPVDISLNTFGNNAFQGCTNLTNVTLNSSLKSVSDSCFSGCSGLKSVTIPSAVTLVDTNAFQNCTGLTLVTLQGTSSTTGLGTNSFLNTPSINQLTITNLSVKGYTQLELNTAGFASRFRYTISNNIITAVTDGVGTTVATIPNSVTSTANGIFSINTLITDLICPIDISLNTFGNNAFQGCINLTNVTLNSTSLKSISVSCFSGCTGLKSVTIPSAVTLVDTNAFQNCTGLTSVTLNCVGTSTSLNTNSFLNTPSINYTTVRDLLEKGYTQPVLTNAGFPTISRFTYDISNNIITHVYDNGYGTTVATIPNSVTSTANSVFANTVITELVCPTDLSLNTFGNNTFQGCTNLTSVTLNSSLKSVSESCFSGCTSLKNVTIPSAVTVINTNAFQNCTGLTSLTLEGTSSTILNTNSFLNTPSINSTSITNLLVKGYTQEYLTNAGFRFRFTYDISNNVITRVNYSEIGTTVATIPDSVTSIAYSIFRDNVIITDFICTVGSLLNQLSSFAFQGCTNLTNVTIQNSVTSIGYACFSTCSLLHNITIPISVTLIESYAFKNCTGLTSVTLNSPGKSTRLNTNSFLGTVSINFLTVSNLLAKGYTQPQLTNAGFITPPASANLSSLSYTYR
jgi:hypothetical protein